MLHSYIFLEVPRDPRAPGTALPSLVGFAAMSLEDPGGLDPTGTGGCCGGIARALDLVSVASSSLGSESYWVLLSLAHYLASLNLNCLI